MRARCHLGALLSPLFALLILAPSGCGDGASVPDDPPPVGYQPYLHPDSLMANYARAWNRRDIREYSDHVLYAGGSPRAFWIARVYRGVAHLDFTGFDPELRAFEPGTLLFLELLAQLCAEGVKVVDCGLGDAQYKRRFGVHSWDDRTMLLFAATPRGLGLNLLRTATTALSDRLSARLGRSSLALRLKKRWRGQLAARTQEEA